MLTSVPFPSVKQPYGTLASAPVGGLAQVMQYLDVIGSSEATMFKYVLIALSHYSIVYMLMKQYQNSIPSFGIESFIGKI